MGSTVSTVGKGLIKAVLWDIDGTLIESEDLHYEVIANWCRSRGYILNKEDNNALLGKSMSEKWHHLSAIYDFDADLGQFCQECADMYCQALRTGMERTESVAVFRQMARRGIPLACVSNGDMQVVEANLLLLGLSEMVLFNISGQDVKNGKPSAEPYLLAAKRLGVDPAKCLAVEDSTVGVCAAAAAGMTVVAWPVEGTSREGYQLAHYFLNSGADFPWELLGPNEKK